MNLLSRVRLLATPWTAAYQAPPSMGFSRQEYWSGVPLPSLEAYKYQAPSLWYGLFPHPLSLVYGINPTWHLGLFWGKGTESVPPPLSCTNPPPHPQCYKEGLVSLLLRSSHLLFSLPGIRLRQYLQWLSGKESTCNAGDTAWVWKVPWRRTWATHSSIPAWRIPWTNKGARRATAHRIEKSQTWLRRLSTRALPHCLHVSYFTSSST